MYTINIMWLIIEICVQSPWGFNTDEYGKLRLVGGGGGINCFYYMLSQTIFESGIIFISGSSLPFIGGALVSS